MLVSVSTIGADIVQSPHSLLLLLEELLDQEDEEDPEGLSDEMPEAAMEGEADAGSEDDDEESNGGDQKKADEEEEEKLVVIETISVTDMTHNHQAVVERPSDIVVVQEHELKGH